MTDETAGVDDEIIDTAGADAKIVEAAGVGNKTPTDRHNLRPKAARVYRHAHATVENIVMTQHSIKKGLKLFGEACAVLDEATLQMFHTNTVKLLFLSKRARPDVQTVVAFLTTRVRAPDEDDYKKLSRVMKYLGGSMIDKILTLEGDAMHLVKWWVDGSFAVHHDMKSHTGATMSLGKGSVYSTSVRQKLNTKSSTEAELLVGVDDVMPQVIWTRYFLEAQGYGVRESKIYQDN